LTTARQSVALSYSEQILVYQKHQSTGEAMMAASSYKSGTGISASAASGTGISASAASGDS